jgi:hypothetical protein
MNVASSFASSFGCLRPRRGHVLRRLLHKLAKRAAMLRRDRVETTRVAVALVRREWELTSADGEPSHGVWLDVNDESNRARIAGSCSCGLEIVELRFEPSAQEADCAAYAAFPRKRSARWRRLRSNESRRVRSEGVKVASRSARCSSHITRSARVI